MKVGITGTRKGWNIAQEAAFRSLIADWDIEEFHHGDCVGVDEQSCAVIEQTYGSPIHTHPPLNSNHRANVGGRLYRPKEYIDRNHDIVQASDIMVVVPDSDEERVRSGTWATYRYSLRMSKPTVVLFPTGRIEHHN